MEERMKRFATLAAVLAAMSITGAARADDRKDIEALYAKLRQALMTNKPEATLALETPDFVAKQPDGSTMTGKQLVAQMKQEAAGSKLTKMDIKLDKIDVKGKTAKVVTKFIASGEMVDKAGMMGKKGAKHTMDVSGSIKNDLVKTAQGWKFKTMESLSESMKMDGKPFGPSKMGAPPKK
jgi:ketosteroid isomerase-like protein